MPALRSQTCRSPGPGLAWLAYLCPTPRLPWLHSSLTLALLHASIGLRSAFDWLRVTGPASLHAVARRRARTPRGSVSRARGEHVLPAPRIEGDAILRR